MTKIPTPFNSPLETGVRSLTILEAAFPLSFDLQRLVEFDYVVVHSGDVEDDIELQGSDLKERFYSYLKMHHGRDSQIVIIENQHPPPSVEDGLAITVFTRNPGDGRFGLLR